MKFVIKFNIILIHIKNFTSSRSEFILYQLYVSSLVWPGGICMCLERELNIVQSVRPKDKLSRFYRSQTRWELLLLVAANAGNEEIGIWNYIDMLTTRTESQMTVYNFIKDRIEDGSFVLLPSMKKSRKALGLSAELHRALSSHLERRCADAMAAPEHINTP